MKEPTDADLIRFARLVIDILRAEDDWGSDQLGEIADAAHTCGITLSRQSGDDDL